MIRRLLRRFRRGGTMPPTPPLAADEHRVLLSPGRVELPPDVERMLTDIRFYALAEAESKRMLICEPHMVEAIQAAVDGRNAGHLYTVRSSPVCPEGKLVVLDEQAMEASFQQAAQQGLRRPYR